MKIASATRRVFIRAFTAALATVALCALASHAQLPAPPATTEDALRQMLSQAAIVFTGQVTAVRRIASANGSTGTLEIDFAVEDPVLGVALNSTYTLREWAGLAPNTDSTFTVGRRYLIFLHAPGASGLSSPVGGPDGAIPIIPGNPAASPTTPDVLGLAAQTALSQPLPPATIPPTAPRSPAHTNFRLPPTAADLTPNNPTNTASPRLTSSALASSTLASSTIDLRWIAARVFTPISYADVAPIAEAEAATIRPGADSFSEAMPITRAVHGFASAAAHSPLRGAPSLSPADGPDLATSAAPQPTTSANYADLIANLRSWQRQDHAAR